jgi:hypothetical protein
MSKAVRNKSLIRRTNVAKRNSLLRPEKLWKFFYNASFLLGILLLVLEVEIFHVTIMSYFIPLALLFVVGFLGHFITSRHLDELYPGGNIFLKLVLSCCAWGGIACYLFMATNFYLAIGKTKVKTFPIAEKSSLPGSKGHRERRIPVARFDYFGFKKELVFTYPETDKVKRAKSVYIHVKKGALGFDVISEFDAF